VDRATIKNILDRELGLKKFTCRWVPHIPSAEQKLRRVTVKYFFLKGYRSTVIHKELVSTLQDNAIARSTVKN
jgi:hypothetical protein